MTIEQQIKEAIPILQVASEVCRSHALIETAQVLEELANQFRDVTKMVEWYGHD